MNKKKQCLNENQYWTDKALDCETTRRYTLPAALIYNLSSV